ncbi:unnamed protein product [Ixodes persulcatus]
MVKAKHTPLRLAKVVFYLSTGNYGWYFRRQRQTLSFRCSMLPVVWLSRVLESDNSAGPSDPKRTRSRRKSYVKSFRSEWLSLPEFKGWLEEHTTTEAKCKACGVVVKCGKSDLHKHSRTAKHEAAIKTFNATTSVAMLFNKVCAENDPVKIAEVKMAAFFAAHNVAFETVDHLIPLLKDISESKILDKVTLGRKKCTNIVKNILARVETEELAQTLRETTFSILIDESTDVSNQKQLCVLAWYVDPSSGKVKTELLELVQVNAADGTAENVFSSLRECLEAKGIPLKNIIGLACDNASVMVGRHNSVMTRLMEVNENLIVIWCICHSANFAASAATACLPRTLEEMLHNIINYMFQGVQRDLPSSRRFKSFSRWRSTSF